MAQKSVFYRFHGNRCQGGYYFVMLAAPYHDKLSWQILARSDQQFLRNVSKWLKKQNNYQKKGKNFPTSLIIHDIDPILFSQLRLITTNLHEKFQPNLMSSFGDKQSKNDQKTVFFDVSMATVARVGTILLSQFLAITTNLHAKFHPDPASTF